LAEHKGLAPAIVQRSAHVIASVKPHWQENNLAGALETVLNNTLHAQGHTKIPARPANILPAYYDPRFVNADVDLAALAEGMAENPSARICLYGPPGTGKSAFGQWIARQLNKPLHCKRISDLVSKWVGETEQNISRAFEEAGRDNAVLLLDEVDSFLADRRQAQHSWETTQVNEMLTQMEAFNGLFIASTNLIDNLDAASLRRFDLKVKFHYLKPEQCCELFERQCEALQIPAADHSTLARVSAICTLTPGDFATAARQHRFRKMENAEQLLEALLQECVLKSDTPARHIGFIH
jgi:SpoVK/Ycf46/Vps4 family AAA+-type ATPase